MEKTANKSIKLPRNDPETKRKAAERIRIAADCISQGVPQAEILKLLTNEHGANWRTAYTNITQARKRLSTACAKRGTDEAIGEAIAKAESHYVRCVKAGEHATGLATLRHLAQLTGALQLVDSRMQAVRVQVGSGTDGNTEITVESFNAARSVYGIPALSAEQFDAYKQAHERRQVIDVPQVEDGANGANGPSGSNGHGT